MSFIYQDLLIEDGDVVLDAGHNPILIQDRAVIAQDIKHALIESGLVVALVGEQRRAVRADLINQMVLLVEDDPRLIPGTVRIENPTSDTLWLVATTRQFGALNFGVTYG